MAELKGFGEKSADVARALRFVRAEERRQPSIEERSAQAVQRIAEAMKAARKKAERQHRGDSGTRD